MFSRKHPTAECSSASDCRISPVQFKGWCKHWMKFRGKIMDFGVKCRRKERMTKTVNERRKERGERKEWERNVKVENMGKSYFWTKVSRNEDTGSVYESHEIFVMYFMVIQHIIVLEQTHNHVFLSNRNTQSICTNRVFYILANLERLWTRKRNLLHSGLF